MPRKVRVYSRIHGFKYPSMWVFYWKITKCYVNAHKWFYSST